MQRGDPDREKCYDTGAEHWCTTPGAHQTVTSYQKNMHAKGSLRRAQPMFRALAELEQHAVDTSCRRSVYARKRLSQCVERLLTINEHAAPPSLHIAPSLPKLDTRKDMQRLVRKTMPGLLALPKLGPGRSFSCLLTTYMQLRAKLSYITRRAHCGMSAAHAYYVE